MREINRSRYLRGTKTWPLRNLFVFSGIAFTVLFGAATVYMFPGLTEDMKRKTEEETAERLAKKEKIRAIQARRRELGLE